VESVVEDIAMLSLTHQHGPPHEIKPLITANRSSPMLSEREQRQDTRLLQRHPVSMQEDEGNDQGLS
jgi:hypothetical protein